MLTLSEGLGLAFWDFEKKQKSSLPFMWEAHLGAELLFWPFPKLRGLWLGVQGREWALALDVQL